MKNSLSSFIRCISFGLLFLSLLSGCSAIDPGEQIPSYLHIDALKLSAVGNQGSSSSKITDAWIYMDGQLIGAFQLPCTVPILAEGTHSFLIKGGIKMNGLSATRAIYPFWKAWEGSVTLTRTKITSIGTQSVTYFPGIDFTNTFMADFQTGVAIQPDFNSLAQMGSVANGFEGNSGYISLGDTTFFYGVSSGSPYSLPPQSDIYIEFDYRCNTPFTVGIQGPIGAGEDSHAALTINQDETWNKIYVRLTDVLADNNPTGAIPYKIYFAMKKDESLASSYLYLDNIKLLK